MVISYRIICSSLSRQGLVVSIDHTASKQSMSRFWVTQIQDLSQLFCLIYFIGSGLIADFNQRQRLKKVIYTPLMCVYTISDHFLVFLAISQIVMLNNNKADTRHVLFALPNAG